MLFLTLTGAEHEFLGNNITLELADGTQRSAGITNLRHIDNTDVKFGRIVEVAGDFYTVNFWYPIASGNTQKKREQRFEESAQSLLTDRGSFPSFVRSSKQGGPRGGTESYQRRRWRCSRI